MLWQIVGFIWFVDAVIDLFVTDDKYLMLADMVVGAIFVVAGEVSKLKD